MSAPWPATMSDQDWETVFFRKKTTQTQQQQVQQPRKPGQRAPTGTPAWKIEQMADAESGKPVDLVGTTVGKAIAQARLAKGMDQQALANAVRVQKCIISDIESGKAVRNGAVMASIRRVLGMKTM